MDVADDKVSDAATIRRLSTAYARAKVLHSAVELGVFELLEQAPADLVEIRGRLGLHDRMSTDFLNALVASGLLERDGERYGNSAAASEFLVPGGALYLGDRVRTNSARHYAAWGGLTQALRDGGLGKPDGVFARLYADRDRARGFLAHMDANNALVAPQLAEYVDWSGYTSFIDVGGARGNVAAQLAGAHPHLRAGVFELPQVEPLFDELMAELGTTGTVTFHAGDFFADPLPATDVLIFGHVLHDWAVEERQELLRRAYDALRPGGAVVVYDQMLDDEVPDLASLLGSLNVALMTPGGSEYTAADCRAWAEKAGLRTTQVTKLPHGNDTVLVARREGGDDDG
ncbi:methyltransferase [Actinoplanes sp. NPDC004185]